MRIDPDKQLAGFRAIEIRNAMRRLKDVEWSVQELALVLGSRGSSVHGLIAELHAAGFIEPGDTPSMWRASDTGKVLMDASARQFRRASAERELQHFMDRLSTHQDSNYYLHIVRRAWLFGSMLGESPVVGDIDIAVELANRDPDGNQFHRILMERTNALCRQHPSYGFLPAQAIVSQESLRFLKGRSHMVSLHYASELAGFLAGEEVPVRLLYEHPDIEAHPLETTASLLKSVYWINKDKDLSIPDLLLGTFRLITRWGQAPGGYRMFDEWAKWVRDNGAVESMQKHPMQDFFDGLSATVQE